MDKTLKNTASIVFNGKKRGDGFQRDIILSEYGECAMVTCFNCKWT